MTATQQQQPQTASPAPVAFSLSERAAKRIAVIVAQDGTPGVRMRVAVHGGGCSGFQYGFTLDDQVGDDDAVIERDGAEVVIMFQSSIAPLSVRLVPLSCAPR